MAARPLAMAELRSHDVPRRVRIEVPGAVGRTVITPEVRVVEGREITTSLTSLRTITARWMERLYSLHARLRL